jgi:uroporphyrinogen decarboxylase
MMRQAGRYLPEYRAIRQKHTFLEMCKTPELAAEVTVQPIRRFEIDAAIIFADILLPLEPMGIGLEFAKGEGPVIHNPVRSMADVEKLKPIDAMTQIAYLMQAIKLVLKELDGKVPLIGFSGAPFTLASYIIEGGGSRNYEHAKAMMFAEPKAWHKLMEHLTGVIINYLNAQIDTGVQIVQLFDSWVGALGPSDYREFVLPHQKNVIAGVKKTVPLIHFAHGDPSARNGRRSGRRCHRSRLALRPGRCMEARGIQQSCPGQSRPCIVIRFQRVHPEAHHGDPRPRRWQERAHHEPGPRHPPADTHRERRGVHQRDA